MNGKQAKKLRRAVKAEPNETAQDTKRLYKLAKQAYKTIRINPDIVV